MIEHLTGFVFHKEEDHIVLNVGGVGYGVNVPGRTAQTIGSIGDEASLWVVTHVNQNDGSIDLFGFDTRGEREVFEVFLGISGVGPRLALAILSTFSAEQLVQIVLSGDAKRLQSIPGVGLKKAEKLLFELKGRVNRLSTGLTSLHIGATENGDVSLGAGLNTATARDAVAALEALDLSAAAARRAVARAVEILGPDAPTDALVREGLRHRHAG